MSPNQGLTKTWRRQATLMFACLRHVDYYVLPTGYAKLLVWPRKIYLSGQLRRAGPFFSSPAKRNYLLAEQGAPDILLIVRRGAGKKDRHGREKSVHVMSLKTLFTQAKMDAIFVALSVVSSFKHASKLLRYRGDKSQVVYTCDFEVLLQSTTKIASSYLTKITYSCKQDVRSVN